MMEVTDEMLERAWEAWPQKGVDHRRIGSGSPPSGASGSPNQLFDLAGWAQRCFASGFTADFHQ